MQSVKSAFSVDATSFVSPERPSRLDPAIFGTSVQVFGTVKKQPVLDGYVFCAGAYEK